MCSYITEKTAITGSAKGADGWSSVTSAHVYFDHPYHATLDHALSIDFLTGDEQRKVAVEMSAESARALVAKILAALESGEHAHG
jgi:hypothetical protein